MANMYSAPPLGGGGDHVSIISISDKTINSTTRSADQNTQQGTIVYLCTVHFRFSVQHLVL